MVSHVFSPDSLYFNPSLPSVHSCRRKAAVNSFGSVICSYRFAYFRRRLDGYHADCREYGKDEVEERPTANSIDVPALNRSGAIAGTIDCGKAFATFIMPKSLAESSFRGRMRATKAISTAEKQPNQDQAPRMR